MKKAIIAICAVVVVFDRPWRLVGFVSAQAHSSFENYYAFRGCVSLVPAN